MKKLLPFLLFLFLLRPCFLFAHPPVFRTIVRDSNTVALDAVFSLTADCRALYDNPYDYDQVAVRGVFIAPDGKRDTVDGFFMQDFTMDTATGKLTSVGEGHFKVRYTPRQTGSWTYILSCTDREGKTLAPAGHFTCYNAPSAGFIRRNDTRWLSFDNGDAYIPIGENIGWANHNQYKDYSNWVGKLAASKGNFIRVWMPSWGLGLEWKKGQNGYGGLENYKQENAYYLDWLIDLCRQKGVYLMLSLDHHGQVSSKVDPNWNENPYNAANGGPCKFTWEFFTDQTARHLIKNRFRYIVARYGYSPHIMSWELFNEVDWTDDFVNHRQDVTAWHSDMAAWLRGKDVNRHLITTSYGAAVYDSACWSLPDIDFTQTHYYVASPALDSILSAGCTTYHEKYGKPTLNGEFGLGGDDHMLTAMDPGGIHVHNAIWATMLGGGMGAAMSWFWDSYVDPRQLYANFRPLAEFAASIKFVRSRFAPVEVTMTVDPSDGPDHTCTTLRIYALRSADSSSVAGWVQNKDYNWQYVKNNGAPQPVYGAHLQISDMKNGDYKLVWSDCHTGSPVSETTVHVQDHFLRISCPAISWDLAFRVTPLQ